MKSRLGSLDLTDFAQALSDLMGVYDKCRAQWLETFPTADGFDDWFRRQMFPDKFPAEEAPHDTHPTP